ncbi:MAG: hypothetical protein AAFQ82_01865 [Myxococcota bacterium]
MQTAAHDNWSPLSPLEWFFVFVAGFLAMVLFFFKFYAGVFAVEIYEELNVELPGLTLLTLNGVVPLSTGLIATASLIASLVPPVNKKTGVRRALLTVSLLVGLLGLIATLFGLYAPVMG